MVSYEELKYVGFVKLIEVKALVLLSNIYDFFKDNSGFLKSSTVVSVENKFISAMRLINEKQTMLCDYKLGFADDKVDKYSPTFIKNIVVIINSYIQEKTYFVEEFFVKFIDAEKSVFKYFVYRTESILEKELHFAIQALHQIKFVVGGMPIIGDATQSTITIHIDMAIQWIEITTSSIKDYGIFGTITSTVEHVVKKSQATSTSIIQIGFEYVSQVLVTTKSVVGGIPIIGEARQSIITIHIDIVIQLIETTTYSIKEYGIFWTITSAVEHVVKETNVVGVSIVQKGLNFVSLALDTTTSIVERIPIIGDVAQSIITKQTIIFTHVIETTTSSIKEYGIFGTISIATEHFVKEVQSRYTSIIQKGSVSISQTLDTTKEVVGGIPVIGNATQSIITKQTEWVSQLIETTTSSIKENGIFGAITSATEHVAQQARETSTSIIQKGYESINQALETTKSVVGGIPLIGDTTQSIINKQTNVASKLIETTTSTVKEYGIFGAIASATEHVIKEAQATSTTVIQKGFESVNQALDTTKSIVGSIPIIGNTTQSIITKQTNMASELIETTTSSIKENGIFGAISSATEHIVKEAQETSTSIIQKGFESASQVLDTTQSVIGGITIFGDATQSIITTQTNMASKMINTTTSSIKENGIFGAITSATENIVKKAQSTSTSIIQQGFESASQALDTTKSVIGVIPNFGDAAQSIITKQTNTATAMINNTTSSIKENGIFGAITTTTKNILKEAQAKSTSIIQKGFESASQAVDTSKSVIGGITVFGDTTQSIITKQTNMASELISATTSSIKENGIFGAITSVTENVVKEAKATSTSIIQKGFESANQVVDTTKSVVGRIPLIGDTTQSIITKQKDMASELMETTTSSIKENGFLGAITSATNHVVKEAQETSTSIIKKSSETVSQALDTTKLVVGSIPLIGGATQSILTKQTDMASHLIGMTTTSVKQNGIFGTITSTAEHVVKEAHASSSFIITKGTKSAGQAIETTKSVVGGIPLIGDAAQSIITKQSDMASQLINSTTSSYKENGIFGAIKSATEHVVSEAQTTSVSIIQKGTDSANQALDTTKSVIGGIPLIGGATQSILTKQADMASYLIDTTTTSVKQNGLFGTITSTAGQLVKEGQSSSSFIIMKGTESANQAIDTSKSVVGGIPVIGNATQSIITKQTDMASQLINSTTSSYKENGIFGAIKSAAGHVVSEAQTASASIIQKGTESASQALDTTKSVVGGIPIVGDTAQSIITKQTDMASQLIDNTTSSVKENGIFGSINIVTQHVVKEVQVTSESIVQMSSSSASQALETTKSLVGGIPIVGNATQSMITKQTDMASNVVKKSTSSVKKHGLFGAIISAAENVVEDAGKTTKNIIQKSSESVNKTVEKTTSTVGGIPILGNVAGSILGKHKNKRK